MTKDDARLLPEQDSPHVVLNNPKLASSPHPPLQNPNLPLLHLQPHPDPPLQNPNLPLVHLQPHPDPPLPALCPFTPNPIPQNLDSLSSPTSPSSLGSPHSPASNSIPSLDHPPLTPRHAVFDPFAPAPHPLLLAPLPHKLLTHSIHFVARRLHFDDDDDDDNDAPQGRHYTKDDSTLSDELFLDTVYQTLLEAIVKKQTEDFVAQYHPLTLQQPRTPTSTPPLTGIAHTCPGAPLKPVSRKPRNVTPGWCRKLEF